MTTTEATWLPETTTHGAWRSESPARPALKGSLRADVCIVGGGFTGLAAALALAEHGKTAIVLEARHVGFGASGRNGGQVIPGLKLDLDELAERFGDRGAALFDAAGGAADVVFDLIARHAIDCAPDRRGWIQAAHDQTRLALGRKRARQWQGREAPVEILDAAAVRERIGGGRYLGGWIDKRAGTIHPLRYVRGLAGAAEQAGAIVHEGSRAVRLEGGPGSWRVVTAGGEVQAPHVVLATNGYTDGLWPGLAEAVVPVVSAQVASEPVDADHRANILSGTAAVSDSFRALRYYRFDPEGRFVMGGRGKQLGGAGHEVAASLVRDARALFPELAGVSFPFAWSGYVAMTTDHLPRQLELAPGLWTCLGYQGRGVAMATLLGTELGRLLAGAREQALMPPLPLQAVRFHALFPLATTAVSSWSEVRDSLDRLRSGAI